MTQKPLFIEPTPTIADGFPPLAISDCAKTHHPQTSAFTEPIALRDEFWYGAPHFQSTTKSPKIPNP
jgi:hypothetical protein